MKKGFTVIELIIVIAICGIIAAMIIDGVNEYRHKEPRRIETQTEINNGWQE